MEHLAIIKALDIACKTVEEDTGLITSVSVYTDAQGVLKNLAAQVLRKPLSKQIAKKAYQLKNLGVTTIMLHWVPGHSKVPKRFQELV